MTPLDDRDHRDLPPYRRRRSSRAPAITLFDVLAMLGLAGVGAALVALDYAQSAGWIA